MKEIILLFVQLIRDFILLVIRLAKYIALGSIAFLGGYIAYASELWFSWNEKLIGSGDNPAVIFWGGVAFVGVGLPLYMLCFYMINSVNVKTFKFNRPPLVLFVCVPGVLSVILTYVIVFFRGGGLLSGLLTPESRLFYVFFATSGAIFGLGYFVLKYKQLRLTDIFQLMFGIMFLGVIYYFGSKEFHQMMN